MKALRRLLGVLGMASGALAATDVTLTTLDPAKVFPCVVPRGYGDVAGASDDPKWPLGHALEVVLVYDFGGVIRNVRRVDLAEMNLPLEAARARAIQNLQALMRPGGVEQRRFPGPQGKPFVLFGGHWASATCLLLPGLRGMGTKNIGTDALCVCIPHRDALLMFAKGDKAYRDEMRALIRQNESDGRKPLTFELFELTADGVCELKE